MAGYKGYRNKTAGLAGHERRGMFKTRLISGIVLVAAALALIITGREILLAASCVISLIGMLELYRIFKIERTAAAGAGYLAAVIFYLDLHGNWIPDKMMLVTGFLIVLLAVYVLSYPKYHASQVMAVFFGVFYVAVMLSCIYQTRVMEKGAYLVWLIFLCSWGCDTCAYCVGVKFGKHKMSPLLSPKKSMEGAAGGLAGTFLLTALYGTVFKEQMGIASTQVLVLAAISTVGGVISMIGDLAASAIKRNYEIKDYGTLIPGHGGILDRFDSVIFTAPVIYYMAKYLV